MKSVFKQDLFSDRVAYMISFICGFLLVQWYPDYEKLTDKRRLKLQRMLSSDFYKFIGRHTANDHKYQRL